MGHASRTDAAAEDERVNDYLLAACIQAAGRVAAGHAETTKATVESTRELFWNLLHDAAGFAEANTKNKLTK